MLRLLLTTSLSFFLYALIAQTAQSIIAELTSINKEVINTPCSSGIARVISNRAMNVFLADKTSYLSESGDLSLYTNYVTLNTTEGKLTINHNFQKAKGIDEPIKKLFSFGVSANVANSFAASFLDKKFENELGVTLNYKWLSKVKTHLEDCSQTQNTGNQKHAMAALRAAILRSLEIEIDRKEADFKTAIDGIDAADVPGQNIDTAKAIMQRNFHEDLKEEYAEKFAKLQAETLTKTKNFKLITTGWTSLTTYIPLAFPKYTTTQSLTTPFEERHPYPLEAMLSHTRLWESSKKGRLFITIGGRLLLNNSKLSYALDRTNFTNYKNLGGSDTIRLADLDADKVYIGPFKTFVTPSLKSRIVYFPTDGHVGISFLLEKNFGSYNLLNGRLVIPIILINSRRLPATNMEFHVQFFDMNNQLGSAKKLGNKTSIGVGIGIPFSRLMY